MLGEALLGIGGSIIDKIFGDDSAEDQAQLQREFAQNGIRWKVEDAKAAGIHPLYALGASTAQYSPISVGTDFASQGQNLGRAIDSMRTPAEKQSAFAKTVEGLTLDKMGLENEVLRSQLRNINAAGTGPGMPGTTMMAGQGNATTKMTVDGIPITVDLKNTPAQDAENQYGEIGGELFGVGNFVSDVLKNITGASGPTDMGRKAALKISDALRTVVKEMEKSKRDPIFNEEFWK